MEKEVGNEYLAVSALSEALASSVPPIYIQVVFECEDLIDKQRCFQALTKAMQVIPCFSSIMKKDKKGVMRWVRVEVELEKHLVWVEFAKGYESYDEVVDEYISKASLKDMDRSRPMWEVHILNYKTSRAESSALMRFHHCLGDGISFMSSLFSMVTCAHNPLKEPSFPCFRKSPMQDSTVATRSLSSYAKKIQTVFLTMKNTLVDVGSFALRISNLMSDTKLPTKGPPGVESLPATHSNTMFPLSQIKSIKSNVGGTVNDVICGIIFYAFQSYLHICQIADFNNLSLEEAYKTRNDYDLTSLLDGTNPRVTGLALINMRVLSGLQSLKEMLNPETLAPWGNYFSVLQIPLPIGKLKCPIESIRLANLMIDRQKKSAGLFLNCKIMDLLSKYLGPSRVAKCLYNAFATTSLSISHVVGPMEEVCLAGHAVKSFNFFLSGTPQALHLHVVSYMDKVVVHVTGHKPYVNAHLFSTCLENSFTLAREICGNTGK